MLLVHNKFPFTQNGDKVFPTAMSDSWNRKKWKWKHGGIGFLLLGLQIVCTGCFSSSLGSFIINQSKKKQSSLKIVTHRNPHSLQEGREEAARNLFRDGTSSRVGQGTEWTETSLSGEENREPQAFLTDWRRKTQQLGTHWRNYPLKVSRSHGEPQGQQNNLLRIEWRVFLILRFL